MAPNPAARELEKPLSIEDALADQAKDYDCLPCKLMGKFPGSALTALAAEMLTRIFFQVLPRSLASESTAMHRACPN